MKTPVKFILSAVVAVFSIGLYADEWSQNDQYYFEDDNDTSSIHQAVNSVNQAESYSVDLSVMEVRSQSFEHDSPGLLDQYMSSEQ